MDMTFFRAALLGCRASALWLRSATTRQNPPRLKLPFWMAKLWAPSGVSASLAWMTPKG